MATTLFVRRLIAEFFVCAFWGNKLAAVATKWIVLALTTLLAVKDDTKMTVSVPGLSEWNLTVGAAVAIIVGIVWLFGAAVAAWMLCCRSLLRLGHEIITIGNMEYGLEVYNDGWEAAEVSAYVTECADQEGVRLRGLGNPLPAEVRWVQQNRGSHKEARISTEIPSLALIFSIVGTPGSQVYHLAVPQVNERRLMVDLIDMNGQRLRRPKTWIKVKVQDKHSTVASQWYSITPVDGDFLSYRCVAESPPWERTWRVAWDEWVRRVAAWRDTVAAAARREWERMRDRNRRGRGRH